MTIKELKEMINLMQENGLTELEIEKNGFKIRLKKGISGAMIHEDVPVTRRAQAAVETVESADLGKMADDPNVATIRSPMVGTFYAAPAPDAEPYVSSGKDVKVGDVLCIIEAMKLMNEIKCEIKGRITEVLVQNGQPVEFDQPLFKIQKS